MSACEGSGGGYASPALTCEAIAPARLPGRNRLSASNSDARLLAPMVTDQFLMPYVMIGPERLFEILADEVGEVAADHAVSVTKRIWRRVRLAFDSVQDKAVLDIFGERPQASAGLIAEILQEKLMEDEGLAEELERLVVSESPDGSGTAVQIVRTTVTHHVDVRNAQISGGVVTGIITDLRQEPDLPAGTGQGSDPGRRTDD